MMMSSILIQRNSLAFSIIVAPRVEPGLFIFEILQTIVRGNFQ